MSLRRERHPDMNLNDVEYSITYQLCQNFDVDRSWEQLAMVIGYSTSAILTFELETRRPDGSPTKKLLWDWGSRGGTVRDLYGKLAMINRAQSMRMLEHIMNKEKEKKEAQKEKPVNKSLESEGTSLENNSMLSVSPDPSTMSYNPSTLPAPVMNKRSKMHNETIKEDININKQSSKTAKSADKQFKNVLMPEPGAASVEMPQCQADGPACSKSNMGAASSSSVTKFNRVRSVIEEYGQNADLAQLSMEEREMVGAMINTPHYTYKELSQATGGFTANNKLGQGKFGAVYLGMVKNTKCAIKKLIQKHDKQGEDSNTAHMAAELKALCRYRHENIVALYGYALDGGEVCLVYQYMPNKSLDDCLHCKVGQSIVLTWQQRLAILQGAACGLQFLHTVDKKPVIHGDIKSANILLDRHFEAKIGDLGLAQQATGGDVTGKLTHISKQQTSVQDYKNTAYYSPEIKRGNGFSIKGDTFAFGVVIFECLTGQEAFDERREGSTDEKFLLTYLSNAVLDKPSINKQKMFQDSRLEKAYPDTMFEKMFDLGEKCTETKKKDRPTMVEVYQELDNLEKVYTGSVYLNVQEMNLDKLPRKGSDAEKPYSITEATGVSFDSNGGYSPGVKSDNPHASGNTTPSSPNPAPVKPAPLASPIDCFPKNQPIPEAFRLQLEIDRKNQQLQTPEYENVEKKMQKIYASDPKKLAEMEKSDREFNAPMKAVESETDFLVSDYKKANAIEEFDKQNMREGDKTDQAQVGAEYVSDPKKLAMIEGQDCVEKNARAVESHDYENVPHTVEKANDQFNTEYPDVKGAGSGFDLDDEFAAIAGKAKKGDSSMMDLFKKYDDMKLDEEFQYNDGGGDYEDFSDFGNFGLEKEDSETSTIKEDLEDFHLSDISDDALFARESQASFDNEQKPIQTMEASLEDHQRRLARYTEMTAHNSEATQVEQQSQGLQQGGNTGQAICTQSGQCNLNLPRTREPTEGADDE